MEPIAVVTALVAALFIFGRGPFLVAPAATAVFDRDLFSNHRRIRIFGGLLLLLGVAMIVTAREANAAPRDITIVIQSVGWVAVVGALVPITAPGFSRRCLLQLCSTPDEFLRTVGAVNVVIGLGFAFVAFFIL